MEALLQHQKLCDELHALALEENQFLRQHQRVPGPDLIERRRGLLARLDAALAALRAAPRETPLRPALREALERAGARILQLMQLDRENEQLLLRFSLAVPRPVAAVPAAPAPAFLRRIYQPAG
jgi:hypothetical protein